MRLEDAPEIDDPTTNATWSAAAVVELRRLRAEVAALKRRIGLARRAFEKLYDPRWYDHADITRPLDLRKRLPRGRR